MKKPRRVPEPPDADLWHRVAREVKPLKRKSAPRAKPPAPEKPKPKPSRAAAPRIAAKPPPAARPAPELVAGAAQGLDRRNAQRLRRGQMAIDARIDLHGCTLAAAHAALNDFIARAAGRGLRCVLVITGKGTGGAGLIRRDLPRWLNDGALRPAIVAFSDAQPKDGGSGAVYVYLRRRRAP